MTSISIYTSAIPATQSKLCNTCNLIKLLTLFSKRKQSLDGYQPKCKACIKEYDKDYKLTNKERIKSYQKEYAKENKADYAARTAKRRATQLNATPLWVELDLIKQLYIDCRILSESIGTEHHVDHIIPLQSEFVCGLHCIANLRIIPATENLSKSNSYWSDMW